MAKLQLPSATPICTQEQLEGHERAKANDRYVRAYGAVYVQGAVYVPTHDGGVKQVQGCPGGMQWPECIIAKEEYLYGWSRHDRKELPGGGDTGQYWKLNAPEEGAKTFNAWTAVTHPDFLDAVFPLVSVDPVGWVWLLSWTRFLHW